MESEGKIFTAGVFDLFHAGHMESIMKILDMFPGRQLIIGVASNAYTESFKRTPIQSMEERVNTIKVVFKTNNRIMIIEDPLEDYMESYTASFYDKYGITDHCQGSDFDENPKCYEYIKSKDGFHVTGRSDLMSTTELINRLTPSEVKKLPGDTNLNIRIGNIVIKRIVHGSVSFIDDAYSKLFEKKLFGITSYQRFNDLVFLPFIEGNVTPGITVKEVVDLSGEIAKSGLKPMISIIDVFRKYDFFPDRELYSPLLDDMSYVSHGDMAYTNIVKGQGVITPIDWEFLCYSVRYWDLGCFLASLYTHKHNSANEILEKLLLLTDSRLAILATMLLCDYWIAWSISTKHDYFSKELKELRIFLAKHV